MATCTTDDCGNPRRAGKTDCKVCDRYKAQVRRLKKKRDAAVGNVGQTVGEPVVEPVVDQVLTVEEILGVLSHVTKNTARDDTRVSAAQTLLRHYRDSDTDSLTNEEKTAIVTTVLTNRKDNGA